MSDKPNVHPAGKVIVLTEGCYSDFGMADVVKTLIECDFDALVSQFLAMPERDRNVFPRIGLGSTGQFIAWLMREKFIEPLEHSEYHLGSYGLGDKR